MAARSEQSSSEMDDHYVDGVQPGADVLGSATDGPRGLERLRERIGRGETFGWARRHSLTLAGLVAGLVVLAAGTAGIFYIGTRPPAPDPVVALTFTGQLSAGFASPNDSVDYSLGTFDSQGRFMVASTYVVATQVPGDVDTLVGVVGPGLTNPTSTIARVDVAHRGVGTLGATVDCSDTRWWDAHDADYRARVSRTNRYGQVTTYDAPLDGPTVRDSFGVDTGTGWRVLVKNVCVDDLLRRQP